MERRGIPEAWVVEALKLPDQVVQGKWRPLGCAAATQDSKKGQLLRVIFEDTSGKYVVITAYLTSDIERYWKDQMS